jgi:hypothetical protein
MVEATTIETTLATLPWMTHKEVGRPSRTFVCRIMCGLPIFRGREPLGKAKEFAGP